MRIKNWSPFILLLKLLRSGSFVLALMLVVMPLSAAAAEMSQSWEQVPMSKSISENIASQGETQAEPYQRKIVGYFNEGRDNELGGYYTVHDIPWGKVTHINYAYAAVGSDNRIQIMDEEAAIRKMYPGRDVSLPYRGHFNLLNTYKRQYPDTKTLISIGGPSGSVNYFTMTDTPSGIDTFTDSVIDFIRLYGFDGVDISFFYPTSTANIGNPMDFDVMEPRRGTIYPNFISLIKELRKELDSAGVEDDKHYLLTMTASAEHGILSGMGQGEYAQYLDYINLMTYGFRGPYNSYTGPHSPLYSDSRDPENGLQVSNIDWAYKYYRGVLPAEKINIGIPYYTVGWKNVTPRNYLGGIYGRIPMGGGGADGDDGIWNDPLPAVPAGINPLYHVKNLLEDPTLGYELYWGASAYSRGWHSADS